MTLESPPGLPEPAAPPARPPDPRGGVTMEEHYKTLELDPDATPEQVKAAYLDLVKVWHPDRFQDDRLRAKAEEKLKLVTDAYRHLRESKPEPPPPPSQQLATRPVMPVAKPAGPKIAVVATPEEMLEEDPRSPWELHGWAYSIMAHALLLLILGLWYFGGKPSQVRTFDTRLAGSQFGVDEGLTNLGGLDTPVAMPELAPSPPTPESTFTRLQQNDAIPTPLAGLTSSGNPGAGAGDGFGLARFGNGGEEVRGVKVQVGDPQFTLLWDTKADIDLHVVEPGGKEIYWNDRKGRQGGELDVDNVEGFGPENIYWLKQNEDGSKELGPGPPGEYKWFVLYYGGNNGIPVPTRWKVRVKHEGRVEIFNGRLNVPGARTKSYTLTVGTPGPTNGTMPDFKP